MFFAVLPHGTQVPAGSRMKAFLLTDNWDDWFTYSTMYSLVVYDAKGQDLVAGEVKIGQFGMRKGQRRPEIPDEFDQLSRLLKKSVV